MASLVIAKFNCAAVDSCADCRDDENDKDCIWLVKSSSGAALRGEYIDGVCFRDELDKVFKYGNDEDKMSSLDHKPVTDSLNVDIASSFPAKLIRVISDEDCIWLVIISPGTELKGGDIDGVCCLDEKLAKVLKSGNDENKI